MKEKTMPLEGGNSGQIISNETINQRSIPIIKYLEEQVFQAGSETGKDYSQAYVLLQSLGDTLSGKWQIGDPSIKRIDRAKTIHHGRDYKEAARGEYLSTTSYFGWSERYFSRQNMDPKMIPSSQDKAATQLRILDWWIGDDQGDPKTVIQQLKAVRDTSRTDFIDQLKSSFYLAGESRKEEMIKKMEKLGLRIDETPVEELTIQLESMYLPPGMQNSIINRLASIRLSASLGGKPSLTIVQPELPSYEIDLSGQKHPLAALPRILGNAVDLSQNRRK